MQSVYHISFSEEEILRWADDFQTRTGRWPNQNSGNLAEIDGISWRTIDSALRHGRAGLAGGSSLSRLLAAKRDVFHLFDRPPLTEEQILEWADAFRRRTGDWPANSDAITIPEAGPGDTWRAIDGALRLGRRGLPGGSSLALFLAARRGVRSKGHLAPLREGQILAWADAFHARERRWPTPTSGPIYEAPGETWKAVHCALASGLRGLPGRSSLPQLLVARRGVKDLAHRPKLSIPQILAWANAHRERTGRWPVTTSGPIADAPDENWTAVQVALDHGLRGLEGGSSLARLLARERGVRNEKDLRPFIVSEIRGWADAHRVRDGAWPKSSSGPIPEAPNETWLRVHTALMRGLRGLPGCSSLAQLLADERGVRNIGKLAPLSVQDILNWADAFHSRTGRWPTNLAGPIPEAPGEKWQGVQNALRIGLRGLPGGSSLARLLHENRALNRAIKPGSPCLKAVENLRAAGSKAAFHRSPWERSAAGRVRGTWQARRKRLSAAIRDRAIIASPVEPSRPERPKHTSPGHPALGFRRATSPALSCRRSSSSNLGNPLLFHSAKDVG